MISKVWPLPSAAAISSIRGAMLPASFRTGMTTETAGGAAVVGVSLMLCPRFWCGDKLAGSPSDAPQRWARKRLNVAVGAVTEGKPARGVPVAHQQRPDHADHGAQDDVARKMRCQ